MWWRNKGGKREMGRPTWRGAESPVEEEGRGGGQGQSWGTVALAAHGGRPLAGGRAGNVLIVQVPLLVHVVLHAELAHRAGGLDGVRVRVRVRVRVVRVRVRVVRVRVRS